MQKDFHRPVYSQYPHVNCEICIEKSILKTELSDHKINTSRKEGMLVGEIRKQSNSGGVDYTLNCNCSLLQGVSRKHLLAIHNEKK